jgi:hypothetical protein
MFERLMIRGAALAERTARRRKGEAAEALRAELGRRGSVTETDEGVTLSGPGLGRPFALDPALRWLLQGIGR